MVILIKRIILQLIWGQTIIVVRFDWVVSVRNHLQAVESLKPVLLLLSLILLELVRQVDLVRWLDHCRSLVILLYSDVLAQIDAFCVYFLLSCNHLKRLLLHLFIRPHKLLLEIIHVELPWLPHIGLWILPSLRLSHPLFLGTMDRTVRQWILVRIAMLLGVSVATASLLMAADNFHRIAATGFIVAACADNLRMLARALLTGWNSLRLSNRLYWRLLSGLDRFRVQVNWILVPESRILLHFE